MARVLLVHGASHGAWCWRDVVPALSARGHDVGTVDLPSVARAPDGLGDATLDGDVAAIVAELDGPAVLVGHSAAGYAITRAAALDPAKVALLIYLCAYVPRPGATIADLAREAPGQPLDGRLEIDRTHLALRFRDTAVEANLYDDCAAEVIDYARPRLGWQAIRPQLEAVASPDAVPSHYIVCTRDRAIPPEQQRDMAAGLPGARLHALATGHSPFFAAPGALSELLDRILRGP